MTEIIKQKIELLEDLCVLKRHNEPRRKLVREALRQCGTELRMEQMLHDVITGDTTIDAVLKKKGLM